MPADAKLDRCKALADHQLMGEMPGGAHASLFEERRVVDQ